MVPDGLTHMFGGWLWQCGPLGYVRPASGRRSLASALGDCVPEAAREDKPKCAGTFQVSTSVPLATKNHMGKARFRDGEIQTPPLYGKRCKEFVTNLYNLT